MSVTKKMQKSAQNRLQNENFFALILRGLRGYFFKNADFCCKMNFFDLCPAKSSMKNYVKPESVKPRKE